MKIQSLAWSLMLTALLGSLVFAQVPAGQAQPSSLTQAKDCAAGRCWGAAPPEAVPVQEGGSSTRGMVTDAVPPRPPANVGEKTSSKIDRMTPEQFEKLRKRQDMFGYGLSAVMGGYVGLMLGGLILGACAPFATLAGCALLGAAAGVGIFMGLRAIGRRRAAA